MNGINYCVNCDCDCMLELGYKLGDVVRWFASSDAKQSYEDDYDENGLKAIAIEYLTNKIRRYKGHCVLLCDVLDKTWNEI